MSSSDHYLVKTIANSFPPQLDRTDQGQEEWRRKVVG